MNSRPLYQAAVAELEGVLSPRVVSRSLKEGLSQIGTTPEQLDYSGLERILKGQVYRQLQVTMPIEQAKETITELLARLRPQGNGSVGHSPTPAPLDGQQQAVAELKDKMRPFNLYFEWPEVQKLRAQLKLLETEQSEGREAGNLLRQAREQLRIVSQKLEDQLVIQAREIGELEVMIDGVRTLGGPKLRRLENLLGQILEAQKERQLASAEVERARRLGADLRKLLESSVLTARQEAPPEDGAVIEIDTETDEEPLTVVQDDLEQEVHARLLQIDLESEEHDLGAVESAHHNLLEHRPELGERLQELQASLSAGEPLGERLSGLREELEAATSELRQQLDAELRQLGDDALRFKHHVDTAELSQAVQVARGVLESTLPAFHDIRRIRDLHQLASQRAGEAEAQEAAAEDDRQLRLREQGSAIEAMTATLELHRADKALTPQIEALQDGLSALQAAHGQQEPVPELLAAVRRSEERLIAAAGGDSGQGAETPRARARTLLAELEALPLQPEMRERAAAISEKLASIGDLRAQGGAGEADQLAEVEVLLKALRLELRDVLSRRLQAAQLEATRLGERSTLEKITQAREQLGQDSFPSLHEIESALRGAVDRRRQDELSELRTLELEVGRFAGLGLSGFDELRGLLEQAALEPESAGLLSRSWLQLEALRSTVEQRLESVEGRLDRSLEGLARVEKLNSEDVEEVRRILHHLDGQRASLGRVSLGLRLELESSLQHAEGLLEKLQQEYEATRAIADQLVSGNFIDDMLGLLGSNEPRPEAEAQEIGLQIEEQREPIEARSDNPKLNAWLDGYLAEEGVEAVALLDAQGKLVAGRLGADPASTRRASDDFMQQLAQLGAELGRGNPQIATVEMGSLALVTSRPLDGHRLLILLESSSAMSRVLHRLRFEVAGGPVNKKGDGPPLAG